MKNKRYIINKFLFLAAVFSIVLPLSIAAKSNSNDGKLTNKTTYSGTIVTFSGRTQGFNLEIKGTTSDADVKNDLNILKSEGQDGFQRAIEKQNLGYFALDGQLGQDLEYVTQTKTESGTKIVAVFGRWLQPFEIRYGSISTDYPFTYIELFIDNNGKASGTIIGAARVQIDKKNPNSIDFENFGAYPAKLVAVESRTKTSY